MASRLDQHPTRHGFLSSDKCSPFLIGFTVFEETDEGTSLKVAAAIETSTNGSVVHDDGTSPAPVWN